MKFAAPHSSYLMQILLVACTLTSVSHAMPTQRDQCTYTGNILVQQKIPNSNQIHKVGYLDSAALNSDGIFRLVSDSGLAGQFQFNRCSEASVNVICTVSSGHSCNEITPCICLSRDRDLLYFSELQVANKRSRGEFQLPETPSFQPNHSRLVVHAIFFFLW